MFSSSRPKEKCAVVLDIGSSSVGISIIYIDPYVDDIEVIWSFREHSLIKEIKEASQSTREIRTALINAFLELSNTGIPILNSQKKGMKISEVQTIVAAPWSYTITKTIELSDDHPFLITEKLLSEVVSTAKKQADKTFATNEMTEQLGLEITHEDIINVKLNGYSIVDPIDKKGRKLTLTHLQTAISSDLTSSLKNSIEKILPEAKYSIYSFMYAFYTTLQNLHPNTSEICIIDITNEATEIGIVRDGILKHTSYCNYGTYTLAREITKLCNVPYEEAYSYMKENDADFKKNLGTKTSEALDKASDQYVQQIAQLFTQTGDNLSIPKTIFLHTDARTQDFFIEQIKKAAKITTGQNHTIHPFSSKLITFEEQEDTALILAQHFYYHKDDYLALLPKDR